MSNYPCSLVHGGSDPVGKSVLYFFEFHILFSTARLLQLGVNERVMLNKYNQSFLFVESTITESDVTLQHCSRMR